jgi:nitroimidazol reductase NimA-like FMN-containing flavoprotein (pyridoxamine 5'-phosphate oxidase superfamily)
MSSRGFDLLGTDECVALLGSRSFGRIGMKVADDPIVLPVFYAVIDGEVVFRTDPGTKLIAAVLGLRVAFEVDDVNEGWSVLVVGRADEVRMPSVAESLQSRLDAFWPGGERDRIVRVAVERITGRRLHTMP